MMSDTRTTFFAPQLAMRVVRPAMEFYQKAFDAHVLRSWENDDGSVHVAEMEIDGALFHLHETSPRNQPMPEQATATPVLIGLFTPDPDRLLQQAVQAGGRILSAMQDYDYGYRQGVVADPFGHQWMLQKKIR